jgi:hypothetical protein
MGGGNQTSVVTVGIGGAIAFVVMWFGGYFVPGLFMEAPPGAETAIGTIITAALCYFMPAIGPSNGNGNQSGFARLHMLIVLIVLGAVFLAGCAVQSFDQRLASGYTSVTAVRTTATAAIDAGRVSSAQGENVLAITDQARKVLDAAAAGDERGVELAVEILGTVEEYVR